MQCPLSDTVASYDVRTASVPKSQKSISGAVMTEVKEPTSIEEALGIIDAGLGGMTERELVSTAEVTDLLLDVRALLSSSSHLES